MSTREKIIAVVLSVLAIGLVAGIQILQNT